jgi:hypothetical protein
MTRDEMNTFFYLANCSQQDDRELAHQPEARSNDENERLPLIAIISLILLAVPSLLIMTV